MKHVLRFIGLTLAIAVGTWMVAWWMVPVIGGAWGYLRRTDASAPLAAGLAAMLAWGLLLIVAASGAPKGSVMDAVGTAMQVGPWALIALSLAFPALLAASAAGLVRALAARRIILSHGA
jgi:hypothetical protein